MLRRSLENRSSDGAFGKINLLAIQWVFLLLSGNLLCGGMGEDIGVKSATKIHDSAHQLVHVAHHLENFGSAFGKDIGTGALAMVGTGMAAFSEKTLAYTLATKTICAAKLVAFKAFLAANAVPLAAAGATAGTGYGAYKLYYHYYPTDEQKIYKAQVKAALLEAEEKLLEVQERVTYKKTKSDFASCLQKDATTGQEVIPAACQNIARALILAGGGNDVENMKKLLSQYVPETH